MTIEVSCPEANRVKNYRKIQEEWRKRPEYRVASEAFLKKHPWCEVWLEVGVKVPATEIHHPHKWSYQHGFDVYVDFENNGAMAVSGRNGGGHYACHNNLKVCPLCKKKKCDQHAEGCLSCLKQKYPVLAAKIQKDEAIKKEKMATKRKADRHPCRRHMKGQVCKRSDCRCTFSAKKAPGCPYYLAKVRK